MQRPSLTRLGWLMGIAGCVAMAAAPAAPAPAVAPDLLDKIAAAAPAKATAAPKQKRKLLVFTKVMEFKHASIPLCSATMEILGKKTGAWETVVSDDVAMFEPESLKAFDGVFFNSTSGEVFGQDPLDKLPREQADRFARLRRSLVEFVSGGKGLGGNHSATDTCYFWADFGDMLGAYFTSHPYGKIVVRNEDPSHPVNAAFGGKGFEIADEIYVFSSPKSRKGTPQPYSREKLRVLLSIDVEASKIAKQTREDRDYAQSWVKSYGQGRVFYCAFGHHAHIYTNPAILQQLLDGTQFMLGDLKADTTPSAKGGNQGAARQETRPPA